MIERLICIFLAGIEVAHSQVVETPEMDFVRFALSVERSYFEEQWGFPELGDLSGGTIARIHYDVTGDNIPDILLSHDMPQRGDRRIPESWVVYVKTPDGYRGLKERLEDRLEFKDSVGFYIDRNRIPPIITTSKYHPDRGSTYSAVMFDGAGFQQVRELLISKYIPTPNPFSDPAGFFRGELQKRGFDPGPNVIPKMEIIALGEFLHNPKARWYDSADTEALEAHVTQITPALASFSIEEADRLIEALKPAPETSKPLEPARASSSGNSQPPPGAKNQSAPLKQTPRAASNVTRFAVWTVIFLAGAVGVLLWRARRKET